MAQRLEQFGFDINPALAPQIPAVRRDEETFGVRQYLESGGILDEETFDELMDILANKDEDPIHERRLLILRAQGIGKSVGIEITPDEEHAFAILKERDIAPTLCERRLMREVFLLTGNPAKRDIFDILDTHVHYDILMQVSEPRPCEGVRQTVYSRH